MNEVWIADENGWYIKSPGYMKAEPDYQKVSHKKAADSIERGNEVIFAHINQGKEIALCTYVPIVNMTSLIAANEKLRDGFEKQYLRYTLAAAECEHWNAMWDAEYQRTKQLESENAKLRKLLGDALHTLHWKRSESSTGCTFHCPRWKFNEDCQLVDGCWLELEAAKLGIEVQ